MAANIYQISRTGESEFVIDLADAAPVLATEIVRYVPDKRVVCRGQWNNQKIYAKVFLGPEARRYARRDMSGIQALTYAGISAPQLLYAGTTVSGVEEVLVFSAIENSADAESIWAALPANSTERLNLARKLVTEVARHHDAGLIQTDLYLRNFLLQAERTYTLDGDAIRKLSGWSKKYEASKNLALLLSKFDPVDEDKWLPELLAVYAQRRKPPITLCESCVRKRIAAIRRRVVSKYADRKVFRECTDITVNRTNCRYQAIARPYATPQLEQALKGPALLLDEAHSHRLKSGNTCTVAMTEVDSRKVVIKRYNIKSFWHGLNRALRQSRAAVSWSNAHRLYMHEIATAQPIALVERRCGFIRRQAYFLAEYIEAPDAAVFFADTTVDQKQKATAATNTARLFYKLYLLGIEHGDFKATNIKIVNGQPLLIDLDSMREHGYRWFFERRHIRDLSRFMQNWQQDAETSHLLVNAFKEIYKDQRPLQQAGWL